MSLEITAQTDDNKTDHQKIFNEICDKLSELTQQPAQAVAAHAEIESVSDDIEAQAEEIINQTQGKIDNLQGQLKKSQVELKDAHLILQDKIKALDSMALSNNSLNDQMRKLTDQLELERQNNSKLGQDLAKSLELNLKMQFEMQEFKAKAQATFNEERKYSAHLEEKIKQAQKQIELTEALKDDSHEELKKAREKFQHENNVWQVREMELEKQIELKKSEIQELTDETARLNKDISSHLENIANLNIFVGQLQQTINDQNQRIVDERNQLANIQREMSALHFQLNQKDHYIEDLQKQMVTADQNNRSYIESLQADHAKELSKFKSELLNNHQSYKQQLDHKNQELDVVTKNLRELEQQTQEQNQNVTTLMETAERKMVELKMALDRKSLESQDYHSHLQHALAQANILKQENAALKDYIARISALQQQAQQQAMAYMTTPTVPTN